jgi:tetratricopeptide (TPR) repeat protein
VGVVDGQAPLGVETDRDVADRHDLLRAIGYGADLNLAVLALAAAEESRRPAETDKLLDVLQSAAVVGRVGDTAAAIRLLKRSAPPDPHFSRLSTFLFGMYEWQIGHRRESSDYFEAMLNRPHADRPEAIARHLLGVYRAEQGKLPEALVHLQMAIEQLRALNGARDLAQTLTTYGGVLRVSAVAARAVNPGSEEATKQLQTASESLIDAIQIARELGDNLQLGLAQLELARVERTSENIDEALSLANESAESLSEFTEHLIPVYTLLRNLYRDDDQYSKAREVLGLASELADQTDEQDPSLARILNAQASADRRAGRIDDAIINARRSVDIGNRLGDRKQYALALHTLAAALIDQNLAATAAEAAGYLTTAKSILNSFGDTRGVEMVERTETRMRRQSSGEEQSSGEYA